MRIKSILHLGSGPETDSDRNSASLDMALSVRAGFYFIGLQPCNRAFNPRNVSFWPTMIDNFFKAPEAGQTLGNSRTEIPAVGLVSEKCGRFGSLLFRCMWQRHVLCYGHMGSLLAVDKEKGP